MPAAAPGTAPSQNRKSIQDQRSFLDRITDGLEAEQLWAQFKADARSTYGMYKRELAGEDASTPRQRLDVAKAFFWAVLHKLTPARRVMLLLGILFTALPALQIISGETQNIVAFYLIGFLLLVGVLILEVGDRVTMKRDLEIAREIQLWLVPDKLPAVAGLDMGFVNRPQNTVAGDYYDVIARPDGKAVLVIADVAGKSIPAALLMATFQASMKTLLNHTTSLLELVDGVNSYACAHSNGGRRFTTAFFAEYDPLTRVVTYINAGHNAPILRRANGSIERLERGGLPLGIASPTPYDIATVQLSQGDLLLIFTDGLPEAINDRDEEFGDDRVLKVVNSIAAASAQQGVAYLMQQVSAFTGLTHQYDDITCLLVKA